MTFLPILERALLTNVSLNIEHEDNKFKNYLIITQLTAGREELNNQIKTAKLRGDLPQVNLEEIYINLTQRQRV